MATKKSTSAVSVTDDTAEETAVTAADTTEESAVTTEETTTKKLVALKHILYKSKQYKPGDTLPTNDSHILAKWIAANTAAWVEVSSGSVVKATLKTAEPGLAGEAVNGETDENLAGKVPKTATRNK